MEGRLMMAHEILQRKGCLQGYDGFFVVAESAKLSIIA